MLRLNRMLRLELLCSGAPSVPQLDGIKLLPVRRISIIFQQMRCIGIILTIVAIAVSGASAGECQLTIARLKYGGGGDWYANPSSYPNLVAAARERTKLPVCDTIATVEIMDERLFRYPFIVMTGHGDVRFSAKERVRLRAYLIGGGFLWADDSWGMDPSIRREIAALFPENPLVPVPSDHVIYKSQYPLQGLPKIHEHEGKPAQGYGVYFDDRLVFFYSFSSDITDGMEDLSVHNDGPKNHETALKMGINLLAWFFEQ
jgi:hypothetical protein